MGFAVRLVGFAVRLVGFAVRLVGFNRFLNQLRSLPGPPGRFLEFLFDSNGGGRKTED